MIFKDLNVKIPMDLKTELNVYCKRWHTFQAEVVIVALKEYLYNKSTEEER